MSHNDSSTIYPGGRGEALPVVAGACILESELQQEITQQPVLPIDLDLCSSEALRLLCDAEGYQLAPVHREKGNMLSSSGPTVVLLPFSWQQLLERIQALMRALKSQRLETPISFGEVCVNLTTLEVTRRGRHVSFTAQEFKMLRFFILNPERVISREELLNQVWGYERYPTTRTVDNHILKLRQKLERDPAHPVHFRTVHGTGYKFSRACLSSSL